MVSCLNEIFVVLISVLIFLFKFLFCSILERKDDKSFELDTVRNTRKVQRVLSCTCSCICIVHSVAALKRWTPLPTFSDTALTDRHTVNTGSASTGLFY